MPRTISSDQTEMRISRLEWKLVYRDAYGSQVREYPLPHEVGVVAVTGGRDFPEGMNDLVQRVLAPYHSPSTILMNGGARGLDRIAFRVWTEDFESPALTVPAIWSRHGNGAGPERNIRMLRGLNRPGRAEIKPDIMFVFPGGVGTAHAAAIALQAGIPRVLVEQL